MEQRSAPAKRSRETHTIVEITRNDLDVQTFQVATVAVRPHQHA